MGSTCSLRDTRRAGVRVLRARSRIGACAGAAAMLLAAPAFGNDDFPPPIAPRSAPDQASSGQPPAATGAPAAQPGADRDAAAVEPAPPKPERDARIEEKRIGRRVAEVIVTPAGFTYHYTMTHLDDQDPGTLLQPHPQLSVPRFFQIDF
jgi:hypothetical protein